MLLKNIINCCDKNNAKKKNIESNSELIIKLSIELSINLIEVLNRNLLVLYFLQSTQSF